MNLAGFGELGRIPIEGSVGGYEGIQVSATKAIGLKLPDEAVAATLSVESNENGRVLRYKENGTNPTGNSGHALGNKDVYKIMGRALLEKFKAIGIKKSKSSIL